MWDAGGQDEIGANRAGRVPGPDQGRRDAKVWMEPIRIELTGGTIAEIVGLVSVGRIHIVGRGRPGLKAFGVQHDAGGVELPPCAFRHPNQQFHRIGMDGHPGRIQLIPDIGTSRHGVVAAGRVVDGEELRDRAAVLAIKAYRDIERRRVADPIEGDEAQQQGPVPDGQMHPAGHAPLAARPHYQVRTREDGRRLVGNLATVRSLQVDTLKARAVDGEPGVGIRHAAGDDSPHAIAGYQRLGFEGVAVVGPPVREISEAPAQDRRLAIDDHGALLAGDQGALVAEDLGTQGVRAIQARGGQHQRGAVICFARDGDAISAGERRRLGGSQLSTAAIERDPQPPVDARGEDEGDVPGGVDRRRLGLRGLRLAVGIGVAVLHQHPGVQPAADAQGDTGHHRAQEFQHRHHLGLHGGTANPNLGGDVAPPQPYPAPGLPAAPQGVQRAVLLAWPLSLTAVTDTPTRPRTNSSAVKRTVCADFCPRSLGLAGASA